MGLYIIGDLHLSFSTNKPMDVFGAKWRQHHVRLKDNWLATITPEDTVIIAGDISWAIDLKEAFVDLAWLDALPGKKILLRGNHDYWWSTLKKMRGHFDTIEFLQNNSFVVDDVVIVGTRGWNVPLSPESNEQDIKVFERECHRLELSLASAPVDLPKVAVLHFPPFDEKGRKSKLNTMLENSDVKHVYFGHIHSHHHLVNQGAIDGVWYQLISGDYIDFMPVSIPIPLPQPEQMISPNVQTDLEEDDEIEAGAEIEASAEIEAGTEIDGSFESKGGTRDAAVDD